MTAVTLTESSGAAGTQKDANSADDTERLGANQSDLGDSFAFDNQVHEKDTATDTVKIVIQVDGLVGTGDQVDSTETLTLTDTTNNSDDVGQSRGQEDVQPRQPVNPTAPPCRRKFAQKP